MIEIEADIKGEKKKFMLEDKDALFIMAINNLTNQIKRIGGL